MISKAKKFIFIHIPKCAGSSVKKLLRNENKLTFTYDDWHYSISDLNTLLAREGKNTQDYFKFCFTRNPYDRLVSAFCYTLDKISDKNDYHWDQYRHSYKIIESYIDPDHKINSFRNFITSEDFEDLYRGNKLPVHFKPQYDFIRVGNQLNMDFIGKVESISEGLDFLCQKFNLETSQAHENKTDHISYKTFYDLETRKVVMNLYHNDFYPLGYRKTI